MKLPRPQEKTVSRARADNAPTTDDSTSHPPRFTKFDLSWMLSLFGTAVGAGILFLPMNAGQGGIWPLLIVTALVVPMTYLSHRGLSRFVLSSKDPGSDITMVAREHFGPTAGKVITVLYFFSIYPIVLIYGVGITNAVDSLLVVQLGMDSPPRWLLSGALVALLTGVMVAGERVMLAAMQWVVWPLAAVIMGVSLFLIPTWELGGDVMAVQPPAEMAATVWLTIPVLVFAFSHAGAVSQFSVALQREYGRDLAPRKASTILRGAAITLMVFTMTFVFSCTFALGVDGLQEAASANLPVLSYIANAMSNPVISVVGPVIAVAAISTSFFGHYLGAAEGAESIARGVLGERGRSISAGTMRWGVALFIFISTWIVAVLNPSILSLIEMIAGPIIASILYLMPMYAIRTVPALQQYRGKLSNIFVTIAGLVAVSGLLFAFVG